MQSVLTNACTIKIQNFEGPFDLLFHLIEKNQIDIYDIPINEITDQYMEYLFAMQELDLEIASEFLLMASTLLHIKSRMLLPGRKEIKEDEIDPREELVLRLIQYKKYKEFSQGLKEREEKWSRVFYKIPEAVQTGLRDTAFELSGVELYRIYEELIARNREKKNDTTLQMAQIVKHEKISLKSKIKEILRSFVGKTCLAFSELFSLKRNSRMEVVTGFLAILELSKLKKIRLEQKDRFSEVILHRIINRQV
jgi:segregation and condensation protein A